MDLFAARIAEEKGDDAAVQYVTEYSVKTGNQQLVGYDLVYSRYFILFVLFYFSLWRI